jgi:hypothetical protein
MKKTLISISLLLAVITLSSCKSHEERVVNRIEKLSARIASDGKNFTPEDWEEALEELEEIHDDMGDCEFSKEQMREVGRADGKLTMIITKQAAKSMGRDFGTLMNSLGSYAKGFKEGAESEYDEKEFEDIGKEFEDN